MGGEYERGGGEAHWRGVQGEGGGALQANEFRGGASCERGESMRGEEGRLIGGGFRGSSPGNFFKIYVSENAFQAILKPSFPYSITSILSKVRHSNPRWGGGGVL